jgi:hypothetical protein
VITAPFPTSRFGCAALALAPRYRRLLAVVTVAVFSLIGTSVFALPAHAAVISPSPIYNIEVDYDDRVDVGDIIEISADWHIDAGTAQVGDTFSLALPAGLRGAPPYNVDLVNTNGGPSLGSCVVGPSAMVCTLNANFQPGLDASGTVLARAEVEAFSNDGLWVFTVNGEEFEFPYNPGRDCTDCINEVIPPPVGICQGG